MQEVQRMSLGTTLQRQLAGLHQDATGWHILDSVQPHVCTAGFTSTTEKYLLHVLTF